MAEQAYQERDFTAAQQVLNAYSPESPNDLRICCCRAMESFGFHDEPAAITSYRGCWSHSRGRTAIWPSRPSQCAVNLDSALPSRGIGTRAC